MFVRSAVAGQGAIIFGSDGAPSSLPDQDGTYNYPFVVEVYYLRACSEKVAGSCVDQKPTLTRLTLNESTLVEEPLVENVEQLQFQYGRDTDGDGDVDRYDNAASLTTADWGGVVNVRVSLVVRTDATDSSHSDTTTYNLPGYSYTPAISVQHHHRKQYERIVQIRNRNRQ
jgi:hypothetical protein